jgi:flagellar basal body-associated protein FliL
MEKSKLIIVSIVAVVGALAGYKMVIAKPVETKVPKVAGEVYVMPKEFLVNLSDGRFGRVNVALVFADGYTSAEAAKKAAEASGEEKGGKPVEGFGKHPQEPLIRDIVTDALTDATARELEKRGSRNDLKKSIAKSINKKTDAEVEDVLFTDVAVQ